MDAIECGDVTYAGVPRPLEIDKPDGIYSGIDVESDEWMVRACEVARQSVGKGGGPFGAVVLQIDSESNTILRYWENYNHVTEWNDPTAHAEVTVIRAACKQLGVFNLGEIRKEESQLSQPGELSYCVIYSSTEPCPMCFSAIAWARIPTLIFSATRFDAAADGVNFSDEAIYDELAKPYSQRTMKVYRSAADNSLSAFDLWKKSDTIHY